jgi:hypothetical protein
MKEGGDDAVTISTRKRRDQSTTKRRFTLSQVQNAAYKRHQLLHGLPARTNEIMCRKLQRRKSSLFYNIGFVVFNTTNNPKCISTKPSCARGKNIFHMRFLPIHHGLHFTCAVIYIEQKKIEYYNSLHFDNVTRHGCRPKIKMHEDTLQVLRDYLQNKHMKDKRKDLLNEWKLYTRWNIPQQDTTNTTDGGIFVCMYCDFILNDCKLDLI